MKFPKNKFARLAINIFFIWFWFAFALLIILEFSFTSNLILGIIISPEYGLFNYIVVPLFLFYIFSFIFYPPIWLTWYLWIKKKDIKSLGSATPVKKKTKVKVFVVAAITLIIGILLYVEHERPYKRLSKSTGLTRKELGYCRKIKNRYEANMDKFIRKINDNDLSKLEKKKIEKAYRKSEEELLQILKNKQCP